MVEIWWLRKFNKWFGFINAFCCCLFLGHWYFKTQSGHWVDHGVWITEVAVVVDRVCWSCSVLFCGVSLGSRLVSIRLGFVYLLTYPSRMMRRLFCKTKFWYCVVLVRGTMMLLLYLLRWILVVMGWFGSLRILWTMLTHCSFKKSSMGLMLCTRRALSVDIPMTLLCLNFLFCSCWCRC